MESSWTPSAVRLLTIPGTFRTPWGGTDFFENVYRGFGRIVERSGAII
jgi:hypothetical protein